jgi:hypothetical protein
MQFQNLGTIRTFRTRNFSVIVDAIEDYDVDLSFDDTGEILQQLKDGDLICFAVRARVFLHGNEIASDYLGGCIYASIAEFQDHRQCGSETRKLRAQGSAAVCGSYFADMIKTACGEARKYLAEVTQIKVRA